MKQQIGQIIVAALLIMVLVWLPSQADMHKAARQWIENGGPIPRLFSPTVGEAAPDGTEYFVAQNHPGASDSNPGNEDAPWLTIQHAADVAQPGDRILVKAGHYDERVVAVSYTHLTLPTN